MVRIQEGSLAFEFGDGWRVLKYDDCTFYRRQFNRVCGGAKAVDIAALSPSNELWLIEAKDYRAEQRTKPSELADEVAAKVRDTLAALPVAAVRANVEAEREFAALARCANNLRVVLHLEQPAKPSKLFPRVCDPANLILQLRSLLKPIDPHPLVSSTHQTGSVGWAVS